MTADHGFTVTDSRRIFETAFLGIDERTIRAPDGTIIKRIVVAHPGAVAVVPLIGDDIILIEQYRPAANALVLEIPAGKLEESDSDREQAATRELLEETGYSATRFTHLTDMWTAIGFSDEVITILVATDLTPGHASPDGAEERAATVHRIPFLDARNRVLSGQITDSKTIAGIMLAHAHRTAS
jgi:ADP-ribose pyrophosphatase